MQLGANENKGGSKLGGLDIWFGEDVDRILQSISANMSSSLDQAVASGANEKELRLYAAGVRDTLAALSLAFGRARTPGGDLQIPVFMFHVKQNLDDVKHQLDSVIDMEALGNDSAKT